MEHYKIPLRAAEAEFVEKKSRFICYVSPASTEGEALAFLDSIRKKHRDANHNVFAYRIKSGNICRFSDDGEPSGTAGMPLLEAFQRQGIFDFCAVATRYFGGIALGGGGLVRAYARCGTMGLEASSIGLMRKLALCKAIISYPLYETIKRLLHSKGIEITNEDFGAQIVVNFILPAEDFSCLQKDVFEKTAGSVAIATVHTKMGIYRSNECKDNA
ncbi:MAG: IMPACT family protein [Oscillospiraceae bacterium]|nr:IMPACT family protein [Oscillospiraceae bacterium]